MSQEEEEDVMLMNDYVQGKGREVGEGFIVYATGGRQGF